MIEAAGKNTKSEYDDIYEVKSTLKFSESKIQVHITPNSTKAEILRSVREVCEHVQRQELGWRKTRLLLGHMLVVVQQRKLYKPEYQSFEQYIQAIAQQFRLSRAAVTGYLFVAKNLPELDLTQAARIKTLNLTALASAAPKIEDSKMAGFLKHAETAEVADFRQYLEKQGLMGHRAKLGSRLAKYRIQINVSSKKLQLAWRDYVADKSAEEVIKQILYGRRRADRKVKEPKPEENLPTAA